jgi:hypothetical protein
LQGFLSTTSKTKHVLFHLPGKKEDLDQHPQHISDMVQKIARPIAIIPLTKSKAKN